MPGKYGYKYLNIGVIQSHDSENSLLVHGWGGFKKSMSILSWVK